MILETRSRKIKLKGKGKFGALGAEPGREMAS